MSAVDDLGKYLTVESDGSLVLTARGNSSTGLVISDNNGITSINTLSLSLQGFMTLSRSANHGGLNFVYSDGSIVFSAAPYVGGVNYISVENMITGGGPALFAEGAEANIDLNLSAKGIGTVTLGNGLGVNFQAVGPSNAISVAWPVVQSAGNNTKPTVIYGAVGSGGYTNVYSEVRSWSSGQTEPLIGVSVGYLNTPTAPRTFTGGGFNSANGYGSAAIGNANRALAAYSFVTGGFASDDQTSKRAYATGVIGANTGTSKICEYSFQCETAGAVAGALVTGSGNTVASAFNSIQLSTNKSISARIIVTARDTTNGATATWFIQAFWSTNATASTAALIGSTGTGAPAYSSGTGASSWTAALTIFTGSSPAFAWLTVTGTAGANTIRWAARIDTSEVQNG